MTTPPRASAPQRAPPLADGNRARVGRTPYIAPLEAPTPVEPVPSAQWHPHTDIQAIERATRAALKTTKDAAETNSDSLRSVLVATDFSPGSQIALHRALALPLASAANITLLHVLPMGTPQSLRKKASASGLAQAHRQAEAALEWARTHQLHEAKLSVEVSEGAASEAIASRARALRAELIVVGRHGRRPVADWFVGTTAQTLLRATRRPVLLVRHDIDGPYQRTLAAAETDATAERVLRLARRLAAPSSVIRVLHVSAARTVAQSAKALERVLKKVGSPRAFSPVLRQGDARAVIETEALAHDTDLIVMGSHGKQALQRLVLGSVSDWVLTHATSVDVLVVRV